VTGIAAVRSWPLELVAPAAAALEAGADGIVAGQQQLAGALVGNDGWRGAAHDAAERRVQRQNALGLRTARTLTEAAGVGTQAAGGLLAARSALLQAVAAAQTEGFVVDDDGTARHPDPRRRADAGYLSDRIGGLLERLLAADAEFGGRLRALAGLLARRGDRLPAPAGFADPHARLSPGAAAALLAALPPDRVRDYWDALSRTEAEQLIAARPELIGALDGVPFDQRAAANRRLIRTALDARLADGEGESPRVRALRSMLAPAPGPDGTLRPRQFVVFSDEGNGRYVEQIGELTPEAAGVGVFVPGTGSRLDTVDRERGRALTLARDSGATVFVYADGELPQEIVNGGASAALRLPVFGYLAADQALSGSAADPRPAAEMAGKLVAFGAALDVEADGAAPQAPVTYIGHSYGGSVVGTAEQLGLRADNVVYASSAGTGVLDGPWHNPNPEVHRYSLTAPEDPIQWVQRYGGAVHGGDPDQAPGVLRLDTGLYADRPDGSPGEIVAGTAGHSRYLDDPGSTAFANLSAVLAGRPVTPYVRRLPDLGDPELARALIEAELPYLRDGFTGASRLGVAALHDPVAAIGCLFSALGG